MKMLYIFLGILPLKLVPMDKPDRPSAFVRVKAAAAAWPPLKKPAAASLKRSSDEDIETKKPQRLRQSSDSLNVARLSFLDVAKKSISKGAAHSLIDETKNEIQEGRLRIISDNPPLCEVMVQIPWRCRYGCRREFVNKEEERKHIVLAHGVVPASADQEWGIDWEEINKLKDYLPGTPPLPEEQQEEEEEVEEIL